MPKVSLTEVSRLVFSLASRSPQDENFLIHAEAVFSGASLDSVSKGWVGTGVTGTLILTSSKMGAELLGDKSPQVIR